jgi:hypothetical protein
MSRETVDHDFTLSQTPNMTPQAHQITIGYSSQRRICRGMHSALHQHPINDLCDPIPPRALMLSEPTDKCSVVEPTQAGLRCCGSKIFERLTGSDASANPQVLSLPWDSDRSFCAKSKYALRPLPPRSHHRGYSEAVLAVKHTSFTEAPLHHIRTVGGRSAVGTAD